MTQLELFRLKLLEDKSRKSFNRIDAPKSGPLLKKEEKEELAKLKRDYRNYIKNYYGNFYNWLLDLFFRFDFAKLKGCELPDFESEYEPEVEDMLPIIEKLWELNQINKTSIKRELYFVWVTLFSSACLIPASDISWDQASEEIINVLNVPVSTFKEFLSVFNGVKNG